MVQEETVSMDGRKYFAQNVSTPKTYKQRVLSEVKIEEAESKWIFTNYELRNMTFELHLYGDRTSRRDEIGTLVDRVIPFTSTYIGSFNAVITVDTTIEDGAPDYTIFKITVQEVGEV